ncbi:MAG: acetyl ornithine aminotransferase family protein [Candidatus Micrarchaeaceae archaeon]
MTDNDLNGISIVTALPGTKAMKVIEMSNKYMATTTQTLPVVGQRGEGVYIQDVDGNVFLDFTSGISVTNVGYNNKYVVKKVEEQLHKLWHFAGTDFYTEVYVEAARLLSEVTPGKFEKRVFYTNSGTESVEALIKIAKAYTKRSQFIGFIGGFHGRTHGSLSFTASKALQRKGFFPYMPGVEHVPFPDPYRNPFGIDGYEHPSELINSVLDYIQSYVFRTYLPPEDVGGILVEPVQGEGGYIVPPENFLKELKKLADDYNIPLLLDEVQTGFGRTGKFFASEYFGIEPDAMALAKSIASGIPMGAVVMKDEMNFREHGMHSNTFGGNPLASAACIATIETIKEMNLVRNSDEKGRYMKKRLLELQEKYESIGDVRGLGLMLAIDFVKNRKSKEYHQGLRDKVIENSFKNGLLLLPTGQSAIRLIPPLIINEKQIDEGIEVLDRSIRQSL